MARSRSPRRPPRSEPCPTRVGGNTGCRPGARPPRTPRKGAFPPRPPLGAGRPVSVSLQTVPNGAPGDGHVTREDVRRRSSAVDIAAGTSPASACGASGAPWERPLPSALLALASHLFLYLGLFTYLFLIKRRLPVGPCCLPRVSAGKFFLCLFSQEIWVHRTLPGASHTPPSLAFFGGG